MNKEGIEKLVDMFDYLDARWQDECAFEDFEEYRESAKKSVESFGLEFISLEPSPMCLKCRDDHTEYTFSSNGDNIRVTETVVG